MCLDKTAPLIYNNKMIRHWTREEEEILLNLKSQGIALAEIAIELGRSLEAVRTRSKRLRARNGLTKSRKWSDEELKILSGPYDYDELEKLLPYTRRAIKAQCEKRGISKRYSQKSSGTQDINKPALLYLVDFGDFKKIGVTR